MGSVGLCPAHTKKVFWGLPGWGKQLGKGLRWAGVREGMESKPGGDPPSLPASARQPGQSQDGVFCCFLIIFSSGPFGRNHKSGGGGNQTWDKPSPRGAQHSSGITPHSPCPGTAEVLG